MFKRYKSTKGITLVALVITIIILLILAGISISTLTNTGIFEKAKEAKQKSENAQKEEDRLISEYEKEIVKQDAEGIWDGKVNKPDLMSGMSAIYFDNNKATKVGNTDKDKWYSYNDKEWANAQTEDGSMWVWIPRYAYRINKSTKTCDIVFLIGTSDNYYDKDGKVQTAQRQTSNGQTIKTDGEAYTVHPAFTNESNIGYVNGGWKKELTGIWVSKFEAGYFDKNLVDADKEKYSSSVNYSQTYGYTPAAKNEDARNYLDGVYGSKTTAIKYPTFQGGKYSMNYINHNDAFNISKAIAGDSNNIYGLKSNSTDSHLMKNSEWGAVAYLGQSQYGLYNKNIRINNVNMGDNSNFVYAMTGYAAKEEDAENTINANAIAWNQFGGELASTTGTIYGIYDMSGGTWERSAAIANNGNEKLNTYGNAIMNALNSGKSTEYVTVYPNGETSGQSLDDASKSNYTANTKIYGDAIRETSTAGLGQTSWYSDYSYFVGTDNPFFVHGGTSWHTSVAGIFCFFRADGNSSYTVGFRPVLVAQ